MLNWFVQTVSLSQQITDFCGALVLEGHSVCCNSSTFNTQLFSNSLTGKWFNVFTLIRQFLGNTVEPLMSGHLVNGHLYKADMQ